MYDPGERDAGKGHPRRSRKVEVVGHGDDDLGHLGRQRRLRGIEPEPLAGQGAGRQIDQRALDPGATDINPKATFDVCVDASPSIVSILCSYDRSPACDGDASPARWDGEASMSGPGSDGT